ncbi:MAG: adenosylcobinamide amidohydrolase [Blastochloris sp.]|nr:adenosylcobinamide amidohydrolase [Blastochloris sp.]
MKLEFPGITVEQDENAVILNSQLPLHTLSSSVVGGGFGQVQTIMNRYVSKNYNCDDPAADLKAFAQARGIQGEFVGLLTAVLMRKARCISVVEDDLLVSVVITAGVRNATAAGISSPYTMGAGTINVIILIDGNLVPGAMVNAVKTTTEAESAVLIERNVRTPEGFLATGTSTDAIVIACTGHGTPLEYAGPVTRVGYLIGRSVRECLSVALDAE